MSGDETEATRLLEYGRAESGQALARIIDQLVAAHGERDAASRRGEAMTPVSISAAADGELVCGFCAATGPVPGTGRPPGQAPTGPLR